MEQSNADLYGEIALLAAVGLAQTMSPRELAVNMSQLFFASVLQIAVMKKQKQEIDPKFLAYVRAVARQIPCGTDIVDTMWEKEKDDYAGL